MNNKTLIILGMHRSGTSLTSQWLQSCGMNIGADLMEASHSNKDGHFEDMDFHDLHEKIFQRHKIPYGGFTNIENFSLMEEDKKDIADLVKKKSYQTQQWAWKDPRTCLFIDEYLKLIPNAKILVVYRDFNCVVNSLINRDFRKKKSSSTKSSSSLVKFYRYFFKGDRKKKCELGQFYSQATVLYYNKIYKALSLLPKGQFRVVNLNSITAHEVSIIKTIQDWGFELKYKPFSSIFKKNYITSDQKCWHVTQKKQLQSLQNHFLNYEKR